MKTSKVNVGLAISKNFNKVSLDILDEPIEHETETDLVEGIRKIFKVLREEIAREYSQIAK